VGTGHPKSDECGLAGDRVTFTELEDEVNDAVLTETTEDPVLAFLIEVTMASIETGRPLFSNLFDEPIFYRRHFRKWVEQSLREADQIRKIQETTASLE
jgi:hypothetical protein